MKTKTVRAKPQRSKVLPDNACPSCGTTMTEASRPLPYPINGEEILVPASPHLRCRKCGETLLRLDEARRLREEATAIYRKRNHLLAGEEILQLRERLGLTQGQLAELLRLGVNTISRWESGRNVQTAAMDVLLRLVRDMPGSLDYLRRRSA